MDHIFYELWQAEWSASRPSSLGAPREEGALSAECSAGKWSGRVSSLSAWPRERKQRERNGDAAGLTVRSGAYAFLRRPAPKKSRSGTAGEDSDMGEEKRRDRPTTSALAKGGRAHR